MLSKTKISKRIENKRNPELVKTLIVAKKHEKWLKVAQVLSGSRRKRPSVNLDKINKEAKDGEIIVVPGKVLSEGEVNKKIKIAALNFSENAREKLLKEKIDIMSIHEEIKKNPEAKGVKVIY